jgi:monoamine oxidase
MPHTVIVGAGIAGLWLADQISATQPTEHVTVLEKYGNVGGRIATSKHGYEIGAGRIHNTHHRVRALIRRFGLTESPIGPNSYWLPLAAAGTDPVPNEFEAQWAAFCTLIARLPPRTLATTTLHDLAFQILGRDAATELLNRYPYRAETEKQRADVGLEVFRTEMGTRAGYFSVREGLSAIVRGLETACRDRGVVFRTNTEVTDLRPCGLGYSIEIKGAPSLTADRVILAIHASALQKIPLVRDHPTVKRVGMAPLTRIYAQYPRGISWLGSKRIITDSPIRYIIPINPATGLVMISYVDDRDTKFWYGLKGPALQAKLQRELKRLFPNETIPEPKWIRPYEWHDGCSYWRPGDYDVTAASKAIIQPRTGLFVTGESFSPYKQAWIEGALDHAAAAWTQIHRSMENQ